MPVPETVNFAPTKTTPLAGLPGPLGGITLEERPFIGKINLRGDTGDDAFTNAVKNVVNCSLPTEPNTMVRGSDCTVFWLGPNEWLIHSEEDAQRALEARLRETLKDLHTAIVDVSDYYVVMRLSGEKILEVLGKGTPLDLHPRTFLTGRCVQTRFGHSTVLLHKVDDDTVDLQVRWSFAEYVWSYIVEGTREYR